MAGVYCPRCESSVKLEQDGASCSNCGRRLVVPAPPPGLVTPTAAKPRTRARKRLSRTPPKPAA